MKQDPPKQLVLFNISENENYSDFWVHRPNAPQGLKYFLEDSSKSFPIIIDHKPLLENVIGHVKNGVVEMIKGHELTEEQLNKTFGEIGALVLERTVGGLISKFEITHWSVAKGTNGR